MSEQEKIAEIIVNEDKNFESALAIISSFNAIKKKLVLRLSEKIVNEFSEYNTNQLEVTDNRGNNILEIIDSETSLCVTFGFDDADFNSTYLGIVDKHKTLSKDDEIIKSINDECKSNPPFSNMKGMYEEKGYGVWYAWHYINDKKSNDLEFWQMMSNGKIKNILTEEIKSYLGLIKKSYANK